MPLPVNRAWDEAFLRVESYLRAHHLESRVLLNHLATDIIREAHGRARSVPGEQPVVAALQVAQQRIGAWFARAGHAGDWSDERVRVRARLALLLADVPGRWPHCFLSPEPLPPELVAALASGVLQPGPELRLSNMAAAPLEFGFDDRGDPRVAAKGRWLLVRAAASWIGIVGLLGVVWAASR